MRQVHIAGERLFVDYSGHTMEFVDGPTGEIQTAQIFVAVMGALNYVYVEATFTQKLPDWIASHMTSIERAQLLIIDDWGPEALNAEQRRDLLEIVDDRCDKSSLLITSQVPIKQWHDIIGDPTIADAILDRIVHNAHRIELKGHSLRRRQTIQASEENHPV